MRSSRHSRSEPEPTKGSTVSPLEAARMSLKLYTEKETEVALARTYGLRPIAIGQIMQQLHANDN